MLRPKLAPRVGSEQLTRVEPVLRLRTPQDRRELASELRHGRTSRVPQRSAVRYLREAEDLFDATVAVRRDDQHGARGLSARRLGDPQHHVVVELALGPVGDELVAAEEARQLVEDGTEDQATGEVFDGNGHAYL